MATNFYELWQIIEDNRSRTPVRDFFKGAAIGAGLGAGTLFNLKKPDTHHLPHHEPSPITHTAPENHPQHVPVPVIAQRTSVPEKTTLQKSGLTTSQNRPPIKVNTADSGAILSYVAKHEGRGGFDHATKTYKKYLDGRKLPTIGIGHLLADGSSEIFNNLFGASVDFEKIMNDQQGLTEPQIFKLFNHDLKRKTAVAHNIFPNLQNYPIYLKAALIDSIFRGDMGKKTAALIRANRWHDAAEEYLNRADYREARGGKGVRVRMEENRDRMLRYANEPSSNNNHT